MKPVKRLLLPISSNFSLRKRTSFFLFPADHNFDINSDPEDFADFIDFQLLSGLFSMPTENNFVERRQLTAELPQRQQSGC